jgi:hypothetical protein
MPGPQPTTVEIAYLIETREQLKKLIAGLDIAIGQMQTAKIDSLYIAGKPSIDTFSQRAHTFVNNAIGEAFNPRRKSLVDTKLAEADAILSKSKKKASKPKS